MMTCVTHDEDTMKRAGHVHGLPMVAQITEHAPAVDDGHVHLAVNVYPRGATDVIDWVSDVRAVTALDLVRRERPDLRDVHLTGGRRGVVVVDEPGLPVAIGVQVGVAGSRS